MPECIVYSWVPRFWEEKWENFHNDERSSRPSYTSADETRHGDAHNSWMWLNIHTFWNLGSVGRWTQYWSFAHDYTTCSCYWRLHKNVYKLCIEIVDWWKINKHESTQSGIFWHSTHIDIDFKYQHRWWIVDFLHHLKLCIHKRAAPFACGARLINFHEPEASKGHPAHPVLLCSHKKLTNFGSQRTVCKPFVDGAAQVCSTVHTYAHLFRKLFASGLRTIQRTRVYEALHWKEDTRVWHKKTSQCQQNVLSTI